MKTGGRISQCILAPAVLLLFLASCTPRERLVVYADPWLGDFAEAALEAYRAGHPGVVTELRLLSSEVVAQHIKYGQPMDVFLCFDPRLVREAGIEGKVAERQVLAPARIVLAEGPPDALQDTFRTRDCTVLAASDRPLRRYTEDWTGGPPDGCVLYADFFRQTRDYLLRGWAARGYVPDLFLRRHSGKFRVLRTGPPLPDAFSAFRLNDPPNPDHASAFFLFLRSEKSRSLLGEIHTIH